MAPATTSSQEGYRALVESVGLVGGDDRCLLQVTGEQVRETFDGLVTNRVRDLEPGRAVYAFMLTARGRPVAEMRILARTPSLLWLDLPTACRHGAEEHFERYLPPRLAKVRPLEGWTRISLLGPRAAEALQEVVAGTPADASRPVEALEPLEALTTTGDEDGEALVAVRREPVEGPGYDLYLPDGGAAPAVGAETVTDAVRGAGGAPVDPGTHRIWRVERGVPAFGAEIDPDVLPQETGQDERAVDFEKGCYTGQEVVARIHFRGKVNRHLRGLRFPRELDELPEPGAELYAGDRARATVTTPVHSPTLGPIALGYVRRELEPGDALALSPDAPPDVDVVGLPFPGSPFTFE